MPPFATRRLNAVRKLRARLDSATHEIAAQLAGYAERRHYAAVSYDDREKSYCEQFPWFELRRKVTEKLDQRVIRLELASGEMVEKDQARRGFDRLTRPGLSSFCATDRRRAIHARYACRPERSRKANKRRRYPRLAGGGRGGDPAFCQESPIAAKTTIV